MQPFEFGKLVARSLAQKTAEEYVPTSPAVQRAMDRYKAKNPGAKFEVAKPRSSPRSLPPTGTAAPRSSSRSFPATGNAVPRDPSGRRLPTTPTTKAPQSTGDLVLNSPAGEPANKPRVPNIIRQPQQVQSRPQPAASAVDNDLSPDAVAGMAQANEMLTPAEPPTGGWAHIRSPLKRQPYNLPPIASEVHRADPLPPSSMGGGHDFETEYDAWRMSQGLIPGHGNPAVPIPSGVADAPPPVKLPTR